MYPPRFDYHRPGSLEEAIALLAQLGPDAKVLAGGASLIPLMKLRLAEPAHLVDLGGVPGLGDVEVGEGTVVLGSMTREADLAASAAAGALPILRDAVEVIADPLVRNVGTVGGNVAHGDPANDHPAVMLALGATYLTRGPAGERLIPAAEFHVDLLQTALEPDEVLVAIRVPAPAGGAGSAYVKFERQVGDYAIAAAAAVVSVSGQRIERAAVAFTNLAPTPVRAPSIEAGLVGAVPIAGLAREAAAALRDDEIDPWDDLRGSASMKRRLARTAAQRAIERALARAVASAQDRVAEGGAAA